MAPIVMLQHSWYVFAILMGMATGWNPQTRTDRALPLKLAARKFAAHTLIGAAAALALWYYAPGSFNWFVPLLAGLLLSIPLIVLSSSPLLGQIAREDHLFLVPSESRGLRVLDRAHALAAGHEAVSERAQHLVLEDARVRELHLALLKDAPAPAVDPLLLWSLRERAKRRETASFSRDDWTLFCCRTRSSCAPCPCRRPQRLCCGTAPYRRRPAPAILSSPRALLADRRPRPPHRP